MAAAYCVLLYNDKICEGTSDEMQPQEKLQILADSNDGFAIAEADLRLRGPGDLFGMQQSGGSGMKAVSFNHHSHLLLPAGQAAIALLDGTYASGYSRQDPEIQRLIAMFSTGQDGLVS